MKKVNKQPSVHIVNLSNYVQPEVKEIQGKEYVTYGKKNQYFQYLIDRSRGSATNGAVINSIIDLIYGKGLTASNKSTKMDEWASFNAIFKKEDIRNVVNDLKRMGQCAMQIIYKGKHKSILSAKHIPVETLAAEKLGEDDEEVQAYYYSPDWSKVSKASDTERIPAFGMSKEGKEILYIKPYQSGLFYYATPDNQGGLQYAELEEEIGNYHINNIQNGFAPSMMVNFNNGTPTPEKQAEVVKKVLAKYQGSSNAGKVIVSFNDNKESAGTIESVPLSDAADQYQFLSDEAMRKILVSHRVTSPLLLGISTNTGFGSNADELKIASLLFESLVINPFRQLLIDSFDQVLAFNKITLKLEFESLNPFDTGESEKVDALKLYDETPSGTIEDGAMFDSLNKFGEEEDLEEWDLVDERIVDYEKEDELDKHISELQLANTGKASPDKKSSQDGENADGEKVKVRYQYSPLKTGENTRPFCKMMVNAKKIYRKEDIIAMGKQPVNAGWGKGGADTYSVWLYKGGGGCHHLWMRKTYVRRKGDPIKSIADGKADKISTAQARNEGFRPETNASEVSIAPGRMPGGGFVDGREWTWKPY